MPNEQMMPEPLLDNRGAPPKKGSRGMPPADLPDGADLPKTEQAPVGQNVQWFVVEDDREVPQRGGTFLLRKGKLINSAGYNIAELKRSGVVLKEAEAPLWWREAQARAAGR